MGYFNINSILYNFRKIFKYLSISLAFISFIILALLLMSKSVNAESLPDYPPFPSEVDDYAYQIVVYRADLNRYSLFLAHSRPFVDMNMIDNTWGYTGALVFPGWVKRYNFVTTSDSNWVDVGLSQGLTFWGIENSNTSIVPTFVYSNFDIYDTSGNLFYPATPTAPADPVFLNYEDSNWSGTLVNGEFTYFYFDMPVIGEQPSPIWFYFYDITDMPVPNSDFENGSTAVYVDLNWFYANQNGANYVYWFLTKDGIHNYAVPCSSLFGEYKNNRTYLLNLYWTYDGGTTVGSKSFQWTTNFSQTGITRQENNANDKTLSDRNNFIKQQTDLNNFLFSNSLNFSNYNLPNIEFDFNQEHFISDLFDNIRDAFIGNTYTDFEFTFPFSQQTITIPSNYVEEHCPSIIVNLIRLFYWYIIGRYILKDVFRTIDKMRQGDWFLRSDGNIKTEVL